LERLKSGKRWQASLGNAPAHPCSGWEAAAPPWGTGRHRMDSYVWIRVVTTEWEYTERLE